MNVCYVIFKSLNLKSSEINKIKIFDKINNIFVTKKSLNKKIHFILADQTVLLLLTYDSFFDFSIAFHVEINEICKFPKISTNF